MALRDCCFSQGRSLGSQAVPSALPRRAAVQIRSYRGQFLQLRCRGEELSLDLVLHEVLGGSSVPHPSFLEVDHGLG